MFAGAEEGVLKGHLLITSGMTPLHNPPSKGVIAEDKALGERSPEGEMEPGRLLGAGIQ